MTELERTFLARYLPDDLNTSPSDEVTDTYIPASATHPILRLRKTNDRYELTKKKPIQNGDASRQTEETISLSHEEYDALSELPGKHLRKVRYRYPHGGLVYEFDIFQDELAGLVLVDVEFETEAKKDRFSPPDFCLADVTQETFLAGGMLSGKRYVNIEATLKKFGYKRIATQ